QAEPSEIKSPLSPASIKRIPKTGDLLMVWNDHSQIDDSLKGKRTPLSVAISRDDGKTWEKSKTLDDDPDGWYCYTAITFVNDRVVLGYCAGDNKIGLLNLTQITSFGLSWLYQKRRFASSLSTMDLERPTPRPHGSFGPIDPGTRIGHVHLKVANLERSLGF